ncbi:DUF1178 family protein [Alteraurantiacibacter aestuarii]|uniref:DUF1178 family protein n=1 Tax=Alteraurantiacibacter aestuarii TaxID=650004 RepID=UPI0031E1369B
MIVFDLSCDNGHAFEGWFGSSDDFASQKASGLLCCPQCGSAQVMKAPMAPAVGQKGNQKVSAPRRDTRPEQLPEGQIMANGQMPPEVQKALKKLAEAQAKALAKSKWVGPSFAEDARAMHYGERDVEPIHGETSVEEAQQLLEEGIDVAPLPFPVAPPEDMN